MNLLGARSPYLSLPPSLPLSPEVIFFSSSSRSWFDLIWDVERCVHNCHTKKGGVAEIQALLSSNWRKEAAERGGNETE